MNRLIALVLFFLLGLTKLQLMAIPIKKSQLKKNTLIQKQLSQYSNSTEPLNTKKNNPKNLLMDSKEIKINKNTILIAE